MHPKRILHPTDYAESSRPSLLEAISIANENNARLTLLHVVESLGPDRLSYGESAGPISPKPSAAACSRNSDTFSRPTPTSGSIMC